MFPVAGLGTRFLPATKAMPKEMLPVVDRPLIQHVVDEAREAGIEHFIFVTGRNKGVIEDHFDRQFELEMTLLERQKQKALDVCGTICRSPARPASPASRSRSGLGHAVWCARELIGHEPFALLLPDVLVQHERGCLAQMIDAAREARRARQYRRRRGGAARAHRPIRRRRRRRAKGQGVLDHQHGGKTAARARAFESDHHRPLHPAAGDSRSAGKQDRGTGGEIQLTDAMIALAHTQPFYGLKFEGRSFDCGSKIGFLAANVSYALARDDIAPGFRAEIKKIIGEINGG